MNVAQGTLQTVSVDVKQAAVEDQLALSLAPQEVRSNNVAAREPDGGVSGCTTAVPAPNDGLLPDSVRDRNAIDRIVAVVLRLATNQL